MRTRVYVDGYNLYYGCLKRGTSKWLDLLSLFEGQILPRVEANHNLAPSALDQVAVKFFTAPILEQAAKAKDSVSSQERYHSALRKHRPGRVEIISGYYAINKARARAIDPIAPKKWPRDCADVEIWKLEEKQSDVNLALHAFADSFSGAVERVVVVTNDTDIAPALAMIRARTKVDVGVVIPTMDAQRPANADLAKHAHWVCKSIDAGELAASQLPRVVQASSGRPVVKPDSWFAHPDVVAQAIAMGAAKLGTRGKAVQWLAKPNVHCAGSTPFELIERGQGEVLLAYMRSFQ